MIRIRTASRLHFGLFAPAAVSGRRFGGVGLMVREPGIDISMSIAPGSSPPLEGGARGVTRPPLTPPSQGGERRGSEWTVTGPLAERGRNTVQRLLKVPIFHACPPLQVTIHEAPPEHQGLGTGTQFDLALARGLAAFVPGAPTEALALAALAGRGQRSAIGTHGFAQGGLLMDAGKREDSDAPAPLLLRQPFPEEWRVLLLRPLQLQGPAGRIEREKFLALPAATAAQTDTLCRLALLAIAPALLEKDFAAFASAVAEFNAKAGEMFRPVQGGTYTHPRTAAWIALLREWGCRGAGQSSWGPTMFAFAENEGEADQWRERLRLVPETAEYEVIVTTGANQGAQVEVS